MVRIMLFLGLAVFCSFSTPKMTRVKVTENISILLPKDFKPMDDLDFSQRFPSVRKPIAAFTNYEREVGVSVNISATQWPDANVELAQKFFKSSIYNTFDGLDLISEGIKEVKHKKLVYFEFESRIKGDARQLGYQDAVMNYTYLQYLVEPKRTLVFSFNCPRRMRADWQQTAHKIMDSVKF